GARAPGGSGTRRGPSAQSVVSSGACHPSPRPDQGGVASSRFSPLIFLPWARPESSLLSTERFERGACPRRRLVARCPARTQGGNRDRSPLHVRPTTARARVLRARPPLHAPRPLRA